MAMTTNESIPRTTHVYMQYASNYKRLDIRSLPRNMEMTCVLAEGMGHRDYERALVLVWSRELLAQTRGEQLELELKVRQGATGAATRPKIILHDVLYSPEDVRVISNRCCARDNRKRTSNHFHTRTALHKRTTPSPVPAPSMGASM